MVLENNRGFVVIEVLISIFIVFLAIVTIVSSYKQNLQYNNKIKDYENMYFTVKSIVNLLDKTDINAGFKFKKIKIFKLNGFNIEIYAKKIKEQRNYVLNTTDLGNIVGSHSGNILYILYKIKIILKRENFTKNFYYYVTKVKK